ncbi:MAG TPA: divalent-cation tolerance protein CutA [Actinophytocola sp.]|uniref:divalent-cation tolerance protein CutA n=1 Tax=Actinophytocola sp. TaxID=1872138 RepID=UPI002DDCDA45|nr:divalent-cation tolerance protein CutA [Actinophytocola sp.]HEV2781035.1 divalent-cation tolerance protein CutA [Actinophytocola sp.]
MPTDHIVVTFTTDSKRLADTMCAEVIEAELGACAQIEGPITSVFRWHGQVHTEQEWRVEIETTADKAEAVVEHIRARHGVEVPEVVVTDIDSDLIAGLGGGRPVAAS